jgi:phosphate transport system permease protein
MSPGAPSSPTAARARPGPRTSGGHRSERTLASRRASEALVRGLATAATALTVVALGEVLLSVIVQGLRGLARVPGDELLRAALGTAEVVGAACAVALPVGFFAGVHLAEARAGRHVAAARVAADALAAIPSVVFAVFAAVVVAATGARPTALLGSAVLALVMVPTVARATEVAVRSVPERLREAALALGATRFQVIARVVLPSAARGVATGALVAVGRAAGETAPLLLLGTTAPVRALSVSVYAASGEAAGGDRAWSAALALVAVVLSFHVVARLVSQPRLRRDEPGSP